MKIYLTVLLCTLGLVMQAQDSTIEGLLQDPDGAAVIYANVALYSASDSSLVKVETTDELGAFKMNNIPAGTYNLSATYVGAQDLWKNGIELNDGQALELGTLQFASTAIELAEATVTASRAMVEVKPDRTVFNVQGTINSTGSDALALLRKAPGATVDNNDNIVLLGRSGVLVYVDGKRLPLTGEDLSNYLQNLPADQIDRFDIITSPGAKYEAEGNAGIIDIRLKKDKNHGANGTLSSTYSQGRYHRANVNGSGNYRNKKMNAFATAGYGQRKGYNELVFYGRQNGIIIDEANDIRNEGDRFNFKLGSDFFVGKKHTLGFIVGGNYGNGDGTIVNRALLSQQSQPMVIDSILVVNTTNEREHTQNTFNVNYRFVGEKGSTVNIDADYGRYENRSERLTPNRYYDAAEEELLTEVITAFDTPTDIDIYTLKADVERDLLGGKLGVGSKLSKVVSDNTFLVYDVIDGANVLNDRQSNTFEYDEMVIAGYVNYTRPINEKWNFSAGLRAEQTDLTGDLRAFLPELQEDPVELDYINFFPSAGLTWQVAPMHALALNYGRRINRPDYNVLNPFNSQLSELSYEKGNPRLNPEIVNNIELGYTLKYRYNFKLAYSRTTDQITRLIAPDAVDPRAGFITWDNLATQDIYSFNLSAPLQLKEWWSAYVNVSASYMDNQADYGEDAIVDVQAFSYNFYAQNTFTLPAGFKGEISGYYSGPGIWGGVFEYDPSWSLDLGLQRRFFDNKLNVRLSASDLFYETGWSGFSSFNGHESDGRGNWDSRRVSVSLSYNFGNQNVKSRKRKTGIESEAGRVGGE